jgi:transposase-like protein
VKYLNKVVEQDRRFVKKKVRASQCFESFYTAERTLEAIEAMNMMRKGQVKRLAGSDAMVRRGSLLHSFRSPPK